MGQNEPHPTALNGRDPRNLRGDRIDGERYYSNAFARKEWDRPWKRIWHVAGRLNEPTDPGDYGVHGFSTSQSS
jgi:hypothetical protein